MKLFIENDKRTGRNLDPIEDVLSRCINPFAPNEQFLYLLKTCFQGVEKGCIGNKCVKAQFIWAAVEKF